MSAVQPEHSLDGSLKSAQEPPHHSPLHVPVGAPELVGAVGVWGVGTGVVHVPVSHWPLAQSRGPSAQPWPSAHFAHPLPPQSTSVSSPFLTPSEQLAQAVPSDRAQKSLLALVYVFDDVFSGHRRFSSL